MINYHSSEPVHLTFRNLFICSDNVSFLFHSSLNNFFFNVDRRIEEHWDGIEYAEGLDLGFDAQDIQAALPCLSKKYIYLYSSHNAAFQRLAQYIHLSGVNALQYPSLARSYYQMLIDSFIGKNPSFSRCLRNDMVC